MQRLLLLSLLSLLFLSSLVESTAVAGSLSGSGSKSTQGNIPLSKDVSFEFRGLQWGASMESVIAKENNDYRKSKFKDTDIIEYIVDIDSKKIILRYNFFEDRLFKSIYVLDEEYDDQNKYVIAYERLVTLLSDKYGEPYLRHTLWLKNTYRDDPLQISNAYANGEATTITSWKQKDTNITANVTGWSNCIFVTIIYTNPTLESQYNKRNQKTEKEQRKNNSNDL